MSITVRSDQWSDYGCGPLDATNASNHWIDQSEERIL